MNRWVAGARPRTLPAAIVPVIVGTAAAANGDLGTGRGLIGGGSRRPWWSRWPSRSARTSPTTTPTACAARTPRPVSARYGWWAPGLATPTAVKRAAMLSFAVAAVAGLALAVAVTPWLIVVGALSFAAGWLYTGGPRPYGYYGFGELFVFVFFGLGGHRGLGLCATGAVHVVALRRSTCPSGCSPRPCSWSTTFATSTPMRSRASARSPCASVTASTRGFYVVLMVLPFVVTPVVAGLSNRPLAALSLFTILLARLPVQHVLEGRRARL